MLKEKQCAGKYGCGEILPLEYFSPDKGGKHGKKASCKECRNAQDKRYLNENPEVLAKGRASQKAWYNRNSDKEIARSKARYRANPGYVCNVVKEGYDTGHVVYKISNHNGEGGFINNDYVGCTGNIYLRKNHHKSDGKLNTDRIVILSYCKDKEEALMVEAMYHTIGYDGKDEYHV